MGLTSRAAVLDGVRGKFTIAEAQVPDPRPGSIIIKQDLCGICGTDVHVYQGHMPVPAPTVLGHEIVGTILTLGDGVTVDSTGRPIKEGDLIGIKPGISNTDDSSARSPTSRTSRPPSGPTASVPPTSTK